MIELTAPFFAPMTTTLLRNPQGDSISVDVRMQHRRSMTGRNYSYVNKSDRHKLVLTFTDISRDKIREVEEFVRAYTGEIIRYVDLEGSVWQAVLETNPTDFEITKYASPCGVGRTESGGFTLTLIGVRVVLAAFDQCPPLLEPSVLSEAVFKVAASAFIDTTPQPPQGVEAFSARITSSNANGRHLQALGATDSAEFSHTVWVKADTMNPGAGNRQVIVCNHTGTSTGWLVEYNLSAGNGIIVVYINGGLGQLGTVLHSAGTWYQITITNGPVNGLKVYSGPFGGSLSSEASAEGTPTFAGAELHLGGVVNRGVNQLRGDYAQGAYWTRELSTVEVTSIFNGGAGIRHADIALLGLGTDLDAYWGMQDAAAPLLDEENANDLTEDIGAFGTIAYQEAGPA